ncbi:MAG: HlyD family efflux transporter periplasmic adaptor subunit [Myxococcales bacterium]|nr:HlyD family efflux transporter periplasmic adaptor subunit [Myxococcales bacterium]
MNSPIETPPPSLRAATESTPRRWPGLVIGALILVLGIGFAVFLVKTKPKPQKTEAKEITTLVDVVELRVDKHPVRMQLSGEVMPAQRVVMMPEVGGRVMWQSDDLVPGGMVQKGKPLVRLDARDYALAIQSQQAQLSSQELNLKMEQGRRTVAEREWDLFNREREQAGLPPLEAQEEGEDRLALREPQMQSAKVAVDSAKSALARAQLQLSKTTLTAPFNAFVQTENVDVGQLVSPGYQLATLVGTDAFWVQVSIPVDKLSFLALPQGDQPGSKAKVWVEAGGKASAREGEVIRLLGDLDPVGRLARILVEVKDPFMLDQSGATTIPAPQGDEGAPTASPPLLLGSFVRVEVAGVELEDVVSIPRRALHENDQIFLVAPDETLVVRDVTVVWGDEDDVLVTGGLKNGDRLVTTPVAAPIPGMKLKIAGTQTVATATPPAGSAKPEAE